MRFQRQPRRFEYPQRLAQMVADIASIYHPQTAIDPNCENLTVLRLCDFVKSRRAISQNPTSLQKAEDWEHDIDLEPGDFWRESLDEIYELVTTTLPFGAQIREGGRSRRLDLMIAERCLDIVAPNGICLMTVPITFLTAPLFEMFRHRVLQHRSLDAVVELPPGTLLEIGGGARIGAAVLLIRNGPPKDQGAFMGIYELECESQVVTAIRDGVGNFFVAPETLINRWDRHFHDPAHQDLEKALDEFDTRPLEQLSEIRRGNFRLRDNYSKTGDLLVLSPRHVHSGEFVIHDRDTYVTDVDEADILRPGDVLISMMRPSVYVYRREDPPAVAHVNVVCIRSTQGEYISTFLKSDMGSTLFQQQMDRHSHGGTIGIIAIRDLRTLQIPILPLSDLNSISDVAILEADKHELEFLRTELLRVRHLLETAEAERDTAASQLDVERAKSHRQGAHYQLVETQLAKIVAQQEAMSEQIEQVLRVLSGLREQVDVIKQSSRNEEEKLSLISHQMEKWTRQTVSDASTLAGYVSVVQAWLEQWDDLDEMTQQFLPSAEHLYDELERLDASDFSPFVIQYCRSLENEILKKLFLSYHQKFSQRVTDIESFLQSDLTNSKTSKFARALKDNRRKHTMGAMNLMKSGGNTLSASLLLQDFKEFTLQYFDERITEKMFLDSLKEINDDFRVKSAHPYVMTKSEADKCLELIRRSLSEFLESYKKEVPPLLEPDR